MSKIMRIARCCSRFGACTKVGITPGVILIIGFLFRFPWNVLRKYSVSIDPINSRFMIAIVAAYYIILLRFVKESDVDIRDSVRSVLISLSRLQFLTFFNVSQYIVVDIVKYSLISSGNGPWMKTWFRPSPFGMFLHFANAWLAQMMVASFLWIVFVAPAMFLVSSAFGMVRNHGKW